MSKVKPLVAIHCLVYNHEPYLRDCFEGFVMQQTNFPFVAIVHDDASTDGSAAIIQEYEVKYPHIFKPIYEHENVYTNCGFVAINKIMHEAIDATGAKYVAMCEGDDYWIDSLKLQKQVDFLETHPAYGFIGSNCMIKRGYDCYNDNYHIGDYLMEDEVELYGNIFESEAIYGPVTRTCTLLYKKSLIGDKIIYNTGDYCLQAILASESKFARLSSFSSVYRIHSLGVSHDRSKNGILSYNKWFVDQRLQLNKLFPNVCNFKEDELYDLLEYRKMQIALSEFNYRDYMRSKEKISTNIYKNKNAYRLIKGIITFYLFGFLFNIKQQVD